MPTIGRGRRGDQRVVLNVVIPRNLTPRQRELLDELSSTITEHNLEEEPDESLLSKVRRAFR
jgi:molecular chaperone DnaJ